MIDLMADVAEQKKSSEIKGKWSSSKKNGIQAKATKQDVIEHAKPSKISFVLKTVSTLTIIYFLFNLFQYSDINQLIKLASK